MNTPFRYVDTHVHFWDPARLSYGWLDDLPAIAAAHTPAHYQAETATTPPAKIVFVQCIGTLAQWHEEVRWIESLALHDPRIAGIVATAPLDAGAETERILDALTAHPLVKGVRHNTQDGPRGTACRPAYIAGARACGDRGLSVDLCCYHPQLPDLTALADACPNTRFVLDHLGKPGIRNHDLVTWQRDLTELARRPHVDAKLSGIVTEAEWTTWTLDDLRPYVNTYLAAFGPDRVVFGSDWPVVKLAASHARWLATAQTLLDGMSAADRDAVFFGNAHRVYRLPQT